jgi:hypothetical protein
MPRDPARSQKPFGPQAQTRRGGTLLLGTAEVTTKLRKTTKFRKSTALPRRRSSPAEARRANGRESRRVEGGRKRVFILRLRMDPIYLRIDYLNPG